MKTKLSMTASSVVRVFPELISQIISLFSKRAKKIKTEKTESIPQQMYDY